MVIVLQVAEISRLTCSQAILCQAMIIIKSNAVSLYLTDSGHCDQNIRWSGAFASRIRASLRISSILRFLTTMLDDEENSAVCWLKIVLHLTSAELKVRRVLQLWQEFFKLRCYDMDTFLSFYSQVKKIHHKLKVSKSVAVEDGNFLRAFFANAINVPDLQEVTKLFFLHLRKERSKWA